jgi:type IV pilus assembly protein PilC
MNSIDLKTIKNLNKYPTKGKGFDLSFLEKDISFSKGGLSDKDKEKFFSELSLLISEGVDIKTAIELATDENEKSSIVKIYEDIKTRILNGEKLSTALKLSGSFSSYDFHNISIGEESGRLTVVMRELAQYYSQKLKLRRLLIGAVSYPIIVIAVSMGAIFFMMNFIVPMFNEVFKRFRGELPWITKMIISISLFFKSFSWIILFSIIVFAIIIVTQKDKVWYRKLSSSLILRIPGLGNMFLKIYLSRFCHTMGLLLDSKVSIITSLDLTKSMIGFYPIEIALDPIKEKIIHGTPLYEAMAEHQVFNAKMRKMLRVGEEVNKLDEMFKKIAKKYTEESEHQIELVNKLIEPVLIVFLGILVSVILIAMYLPLFQLSSQIG